MPGVRVPSVQHLARNWHGDPGMIARALVRLALDPPRFNYNPLFAAARDLLILGVPYEQVAEGIRRKCRPRLQKILLEVLPLIRDHFAGVSPDFYQTIDVRFYPVGRDLMVPFEPPMIYGVGGQLYFPWFSFWRRNPLARERLSLFVTLVDELLLQDPDLETAQFEILDFSAPRAGKPRELTVINAREIPRLDDARKTDMLAVFADGYFQAVAQLSGTRPWGTEEEEEAPKRDPNQPGFFDEP